MRSRPYACGHDAVGCGYLICVHLRDCTDDTVENVLAESTTNIPGEITGILRCGQCANQWDNSYSQLGNEPNHPLNEALLLYCVDCVEREGWLPIADPSELDDLN